MPIGGLIQFQPEDANRMAEGTIQPDGSFSLSVRFYGKMLSGATVGPHRAAVLPPMLGGQGSAEPVFLKETFTVRPEENRFTVRLPP